MNDEAKKKVARLIAASEVCCNAGPGAEPWHVLTEAVDGAKDLVDASDIEAEHAAIAAEEA